PSRRWAMPTTAPVSPRRSNGCSGSGWRGHADPDGRQTARKAPPMSARNLTTWLKLALLVAFLAAAVYYFRFTERGREVTPEYVLDSIETHGPVAAPAIYVAIYSVGTVALLAGTVLSFAGAVLFGPYEGTLYTWVGATIGATLAYGMARLLGRGFVERLFGDRFAAFDQRLREHG